MCSTERATAMYLPPGVRADRERRDADRGRADLGVRLPAGGAPALVRPDDVRVNARGRGNYAREVHDIFVDRSARPCG